MIGNQLATLDSLEERVVEVPRHASALCQSLIKTGADGSRNLQHTQAVDNPYDEDTGDKAENSEPVRLIPGRGDAEVEDRACIVPDAIVIACDHAKPVSPWAKVIVERLTPCSWLLPGSVAALQSVAEAHFLGNYEAQCRVVNFDITSGRGQTKTFYRVVAFSIRCNFLDVHWRWHRIAGYVSWIDHLQDGPIRKPQPSIRG